jgi:NADPH:quinone reductase-like Zn-dependent oxidoreductase
MGDMKDIKSHCMTASEQTASSVPTRTSKIVSPSELDNMALPTTQKKWIINGSQRGLDEYEFTQGPVPRIDDHGVLVKMHAASINFRELMIPRGDFPYRLKLPIVGGCDGAGEVIATGSKVTKWKKGDRVTPLFNPGHQSGALSQEAFDLGGTGGTIDGTFQEYAAFDESWLVRLASNLSYEEGATLSDAAVTAWNALFGLKPLRPGDWVLTQGTGGVSVFAVQVSRAPHQYSSLSCTNGAR